MTTLFQVRVAARREEARGIAGFELAALDGGALPPFAAGAHIDVRIDGGLTRQYSLCNDPRETHRYQIAVLKDPASRGGSQAMHERVQAGAIIEISAPKNHFELASAAPHSLLLAGGIGVTPILSMAERLAAAGASFEMDYCTRSREHTAFLDRIAQAGFAPQVRFHFDDGAPAQRLDLETLLRGTPAGSHLYVCGPKGFMDAVLAAARGANWPESRLHYEFFAAALPPPVADGGFDVRLASSGRVISVAPDQTVVQALRESGVAVPVSCEQGICGTCLTRVLEGEPEHHDLFLTPAEQARNDSFLPCCSRAKSALLVLDL